MLLGVNEVEDPYHSLFEKVDEDDLEAIIDSLCIAITNWLETTKYDIKSVLRMNWRGGT